MLQTECKHLETLEKHFIQCVSIYYMNKQARTLQCMGCHTEIFTKYLYQQIIINNVSQAEIRRVLISAQDQFHPPIWIFEPFLLMIYKCLLRYVCSNIFFKSAAIHRAQIDVKIIRCTCSICYSRLAARCIFPKQMYRAQLNQKYSFTMAVKVMQEAVFRD